MRFFSRTAAPGVPEVEPVPGPAEPEKALDAGEKRPEAEGDASDSDAISADAQEGVQAIEAMTKVWSRSHLILAYVL
jgi:hypothetical protein